MSNNNNPETLEIVAAFVHELMKARGDESALHVCVSNFSVFSSEAV